MTLVVGLGGGGARGGRGAARRGAPQRRHGLTLVHFSAQSEPLLAQKTP